MIGKLKGLVEEVDLDHMLVDVNGVCYLVLCSTNLLQKYRKGDKVELYIETHVREDQLTLFGFKDKNEKLCYQKLVTVKGVGPKMGLSIIGAIGASKLPIAIASGDKAAFSAVSGVGPKLANRIITELKEQDFIFGADNFQVAGKSSNSNAADDQERDNMNNAVQALQNLGLSRSEAYSNVSEVLRNEPGINLSDLIKKALKLNKN